MGENRRQLVHFSGIVFVLLAQFTGRWPAAFYFLLIAATFLVYSERIRRERRGLLGFMRRFEEKFRDAVLELERKDAPVPLAGAFWFYFGCGVAFLLFPLGIASAACAMLAVGDGLSTIVGTNRGHHRILGKKSAEGTATMFMSSLITASFFVAPHIALLGAAVATAAELLPEAGAAQKHRMGGLLDDNFLIPLASGAVMLAACFF